MCCRYRIEKTPRMTEIIEDLNRSPLLDRWNEPVITEGEVRPGNVAPVIATNRSGSRSVFPMKWGFTGRSLLVNARSETASQKPVFAQSWASHRCIVPAAYYYEWEHTLTADGKKRGGKKYKLAPQGGGMTWLCGLYRIEEGMPVFVVLTKEPWEGIRFIHERMPLIMPEKLVDSWIDPYARPEELIGHALAEMEYEAAV